MIRASDDLIFYPVPKCTPHTQPFLNENECNPQHCHLCSLSGAFRTIIHTQSRACSSAASVWAKRADTALGIWIRISPLGRGPAAAQKNGVATHIHIALWLVICKRAAWTLFFLHLPCIQSADPHGGAIFCCRSLFLSQSVSRLKRDLQRDFQPVSCGLAPILLSLGKALRPLSCSFSVVL